MRAYKGASAYYSVSAGNIYISRSSGTLTINKDGIYAIVDLTNNNITQQEYSANDTIKIGDRQLEIVRLE